MSGFGYNAEYYDAATGMQYLRARYYEPEMMRFSQTDIVRGSVVIPISLNRYLYVQNNPVLYSDPSGMVVKAAISSTAVQAGGSVKKTVATNAVSKVASAAKVTTSVAKTVSKVSTAAPKASTTVTTASSVSKNTNTVTTTGKRLPITADTLANQEAANQKSNQTPTFIGAKWGFSANSNIRPCTVSGLSSSGGCGNAERETTVLSNSDLLNTSTAAYKNDCVKQTVTTYYERSKRRIDFDLLSYTNTVIYSETNLITDTENWRYYFSDYRVKYQDDSNIVVNYGLKHEYGGIVQSQYIQTSKASQYDSMGTTASIKIDETTYSFGTKVDMTLASDGMTTFTFAINQGHMTDSHEIKANTYFVGSVLIGVIFIVCGAAFFPAQSASGSSVTQQTPNLSPVLASLYSSSTEIIK